MINDVNANSHNRLVAGSKPAEPTKPQVLRTARVLSAELAKALPEQFGKRKATALYRYTAVVKEFMK